MNKYKFNTKTKSLKIRFYAELNDFIRPSEKQKDIDYYFSGPIATGEVIESLGVPLSEVDLILVNGHSEDFSFKLKEGDYISVYPVFECIDVTLLTKVRKVPLRHTKFILDAHLGKLAKYLRMMGFDACYENDYEDQEIIRISLTEKRIILTRDKALLMSKEVNHGYYVRSIYINDQLPEIIDKFDLYSQAAPFSRCIVCNHKILPVHKEFIRHRLDEVTAKSFKEFFYCRNCDKIYWEGSHFERMNHFINNLLKKRST